MRTKYLIKTCVEIIMTTTRSFIDGFIVIFAAEAGGYNAAAPYGGSAFNQAPYGYERPPREEFGDAWNSRGKRDATCYTCGMVSS